MAPGLFPCDTCDCVDGEIPKDHRIQDTDSGDFVDRCPFYDASPHEHYHLELALTNKIAGATLSADATIDQIITAGVVNGKKN